MRCVGDPTGRELSAKVVDKETQIVHKLDGGPGTEEVVADAQRQQRCLSRSRSSSSCAKGSDLGTLGQPLDIEWTFRRRWLHRFAGRPSASAPVAAEQPGTGAASSGSALGIDPMTVPDDPRRRP